MDLIEDIRRTFVYEPDTGLIRYKDCYRRSWNGRVAGCMNVSTGYVHVSLKRKTFYAHRVIWVLVHGRWPKIDVDHIDRVRHHNRLANLREATEAENQWNRDGRLGISGLRGACYDKNRDKWVSFLQHKYLGTFDNPEDAAAAYARAAAQTYGKFARVE